MKQETYHKPIPPLAAIRVQKSNAF